MSSSQGNNQLATRMKAVYAAKKRHHTEEDNHNEEDTAKRPRQYNPQFLQRLESLAQQELHYDSCRNIGEMSVIGIRHGTDKISQHGYHRYYPRYLEVYRRLSADYAMLEIGIDQSASLSTWLDYFPHAFIYGIDIDVEKVGERYAIFQCDQSKPSALEKLIFQQIDCTKHQIFFIIDDGSHIPQHQILSFNFLFQYLLIPGGIYIIEDIETSYWKQGGLYGYPTNYGYHHEYNIIECFKHLLDEINREFLSDEAKEAQNQVLTKYGIDAEVRKWISTITFGQNCIIITKKTKEEMKFHDRVYRFSKFV